MVWNATCNGAAAAFRENLIFYLTGRAWYKVVIWWTVAGGRKEPVAIWQNSGQTEAATLGRLQPSTPAQHSGGQQTGPLDWCLLSTKL